MKEIRFKLITILILLVLISLPFGYSLRSPPIPPSSPQNLTGECVNGKVVLKWEPAIATEEHPVIWYYIYRGLSSGDEKYYAKVSASVTSYIDENVKVGNTYYYYVTAVNDVGESNKSNEVNVTVKEVQYPPQPPRDLFAIKGDGYVILEWKPPSYQGTSPVISYTIYRNGEVLTSVSSSVTHYKDTSVNIKNKYTYYVTAVNKVGESSPSNKVTVFWSKPQPPQDLKVMVSDNYLVLTWIPGDSSGLKIKEYKIYEKQGDKWKLIGNTTKTLYKLPLPSSIFGGKLYIKVTELTEIGESKGAEVVISLPSDTLMVSLIIIVAILIVVLGLVYYRRKRSQRK